MLICGFQNVYAFIRLMSLRDLQLSDEEKVKCFWSLAHIRVQAWLRTVDIPSDDRSFAKCKSAWN